MGPIMKQFKISNPFFFILSMGLNDIHGIVNNICFVVLRPEAWEELESTFGEERIKREFQPITQSIFPFQQREALSRMNN